MAGSDTRASGTGLTSGAGMLTYAAVVGVSLQVHARAVTTDLPTWTISCCPTGARSFHASFAFGANMPTGSAVEGIGMQVRANSIAVHLACWTADAFFTRCTSLTYIATGTAVVVISIGIDAGAVADDVAGSASANTLLATRAVLAYIATGAAVVGIGVEVDADAIAQRLTRLAACTDSTYTYLARQAGMAAGTAVLGVGLQVYTGATTLVQSALANAGAIATSRVVAAVRCGCSTGLAR